MTKAGDARILALVPEGHRAMCAAQTAAQTGASWQNPAQPVHTDRRTLHDRCMICRNREHK